MEYQALYRKYRPTKFSDVVDQENILKIITNSIKENKISHAYLFSGPRGTGKTTIAKLLAKTVNCLNLNDDFSICHQCENCIDIDNNSSDIIEIDAASNNGVDEIRELKSKINFFSIFLKRHNIHFKAPCSLFLIKRYKYTKKLIYARLRLFIGLIRRGLIISYILKFKYRIF